MMRDEGIFGGKGCNEGRGIIWPRNKNKDFNLKGKYQRECVGIFWDV